MSFWQSEVGELLGTPDAAFTKTFKNIPDGTMALGKILSFKKEIDQHKKEFYNIEWLLTDGDFKGQHVFQKIHAFDKDSNKRHRSLNMLMLIYKMYNISPKDNNPPDDQELMQFINKFAGIKIQEWSMEKTDGSGMATGNWVSEVHPASGFKCETGIKAEVVHTRSNVDSAFSRNEKDILNEDLPF